MLAPELMDWNTTQETRHYKELHPEACPLKAFPLLFVTFIDLAE
jgi:hypothetical protein